MVALTEEIYNQRWRNTFFGYFQVNRWTHCGCKLDNVVINLCAQDKTNIVAVDSYRGSYGTPGSYITFT